MFKKILSVLLSVCIVISASSNLLFVNAIDSEPKLSSRYDIIISKDGIDGDFGEKYNSLPTKTKITLSPTVDLSSAEIFEFDIYVEDFDELKGAISYSPGSNEQGLNLMFSSSTVSALFVSKNIASAEIFSQIESDGWNHIRVLKSDFSETNINWAKVKYVFLKFSDNISNTHGDLAGKSVKLRNICTAVAIPSIDSNNTIIYSDLLRNSLGDNESSLYTEVEHRFTMKDLSRVNISDCDFVGMDFSVSDYDKFKALLDSEDVNAYLTLFTNKSNLKFDIKNIGKSSKSGWYKVLLPIGLTDDLEVDGFSFEIINSDSNAKLGEAFSIILSIASIYGVNISLPEENSYGIMVSNREANTLNYIVDEKYNDFSIASSGDLGSFKDASYIEFDLYIEDFEGFKNSFIKNAQNEEINADLQLILSNNEPITSNNIIWNGIQNYIVQNGWNHIILPIDKAINNGFSFENSIKAFEFKIVGNDIEKESSACGQIIIIDRFKVTKYETPPQNNRYDFLTDLSVNGKQWVLGDTFSQSGTEESNLSGSIDLSDAEYLEIDIYIENFNVWSEILKSENISGLAISLYSNGQINSCNADLLKYISHSGWNHIRILLSEFSGSSTFDFSNVTAYKIAYTGDIASSTNNLKGQFIAVANICGTVNLVPNEYVGQNDVLAKLGAPAVKGKYKSDYTLNISGSAETSANFGKAVFIEFDIFIEDYDKFVESFKTDENGNPVGVTLNFGIGRTKSYSSSAGYFSWTDVQKYVYQDGWNHITLPMLVKYQSNSEVNGIKTLENIQCFKLWYGGDSYKTGDYENRIGENILTIANVCATEGTLPVINVGKDQSEIYITWFDRSNPQKGKVLLSENGNQTVFEAFEYLEPETGYLSCNRAKITGLKPNTTYTYSVGDDNGWSQEYSFETEDFDESFSFIHISDVQMPKSNDTFLNWNNTLINISKYFSDNSFILNTGDISDLSASQELYVLYKSPDLLRGHIMGTVPGNHDNDPNTYYNRQFTAPETKEVYSGFGENECDYWYAYNNVLFISINTNIGNKEYHEAFVRKVVEEQGDKYDWKIVNCHHSLFSASYHSTESWPISLRNHLAPVFSELKIDMVLSGHDHCYDRSYIMNGTTPVVSNKNYAYNTNGGVLYISATTASGMKFNPAVENAKTYSAKLVENEYGFVKYDVCDAKITLTYYSSEDLSILDKFTLYKVNSTHLVDLRRQLLTDDIDESVDYNEDGKINVLDLVRLKKILVNAA